ncbi:hypothetical protein [Streptosporangium sp. NPDC023615]|uniref:hypothetical protein n=1 Tax=Streptosporangium sp. NPDC023615 TaxID=3154794 RepID=UPI00344AF9D6
MEKFFLDGAVVKVEVLEESARLPGTASIGSGDGDARAASTRGHPVRQAGADVPEMLFTLMMNACPWDAPTFSGRWLLKYSGSNIIFLDLGTYGWAVFVLDADRLRVTTRRSVRGRK